MVNYRYLNNYRDNNINGVFIRRWNKFSVKKDEELNEYFKNNINRTIDKVTKYSFLKYLVEVKECNLLNCKLTLNGNEVEFENGKLLTTTEAVLKDKDIDILKELIGDTTKEIREMLVLPLTFNANLSNLGYILDVELLKIISFYDARNIERFSKYLITQLKEMDDTDKKYDPIYPSFPREHIKSEEVYTKYCEWLNYLDHSPNYSRKNIIPKSYKLNFEKNDQENNSNFLNEISVSEKPEDNLKIISHGLEEDFCQEMTSLMQSRETFNKKDIDDINVFMGSFTDHVKYIQQPIENIENLAHIVGCLLNHVFDDKIPFNMIYSWFSHFSLTFDDILIVALAFSNHINIASDLKLYREIDYINPQAEKIIMKLLNDCPSTHRLESFMKYKNIWARLCDRINTDNYKEEYPGLVKDLLKISKEYKFNFIFIKRRLKIMDDGRENLDDIFKKNLELALQKNSSLSSAVVKTCNLLNCTITLNNKDYEFEDGKLLENDLDINLDIDMEEDTEDIPEEEDPLLEPLKKLVNTEVKPIREKVNLALSMNENISKYGYCMDVPLLKKAAVYDRYEIEELYHLFRQALHELTGGNVPYDPPYKDFPREHLSLDLTFKQYCRWLYTLELLKYDPKMIPMSYKNRFEKYNDIDEIKDELKDVKLKILSVDEKEEFYQMMVKLMTAPEAISSNDIMDLHSFIKYEEERLKYIPDTIPNKENLANVINKLINYCMSEPPMEVILPKYNNANDVLRLALVMSGCQASDLGKSVKFKSFKNSERRILMELLNHCKNRYEDILKYKNMWERFCERVHPSKFKERYPEAVKDLLGSYDILGTPANKEIRMEYRFYHMLYELDDRFTDYKNRLKEYIKKLKEKREQERKEDEEEEARRKNNPEGVDEVNAGQRKRRVEEDPNKILKINDLFTVGEHQILVKKFNSVKEFPKEIKSYIQDYLMKLTAVAYTNVIQNINREYINNRNCRHWDSQKQKYFIKKQNQFAWESLPDALIYATEKVIPLLDRTEMDKRIHMLEPSVIQLREVNLNYKKERQTFNSKFVEFIKTKRITEAIHLLSQKPGVYLRHLDELLTKSQSEEEVKEVMTFLEKVAQKGSVKVLLSIRGYFQRRDEKMKTRAFLIKGSNGHKKNKKGGGSRRKSPSKVNSVIYYTDQVKEPLSKELCQQIQHICDHTLIEKFKSKSPLHGVYVSPELKKIYIPFDLRNASKSTENYTKGSRFDLSFKNITPEEKEQLIQKAEAALEKKKLEETAVYDAQKKHEIDLLNLKSRIDKKSKAVEEATKAKKPEPGLKRLTRALEKDRVIRDRCSKDLMESKLKLVKVEKEVKNLEKDVEDKKRCPIGVSYKSIRLFTLGYSDLTLEIFGDDFQMKALVTMNSDAEFGTRDQKEYNIYFGEEHATRFADLDIETILAQKGRYVMVNIGSSCSAQFGWMERDFVHSDEPFDPTTVRQTIQLNYSGEACPVVLDCQTREFIWLDYPFAENYFSVFVERYGEYHRMQHHLSGNNSQPDDVYPEERIKEITDKYQQSMTKNANVKASIFAYFLEPMRLSLADLIRLHIEARGGHRVEKEEELTSEDTAFLPYMPNLKKENVEYINCNQLEVILSDYMN